MHILSNDLRSEFLATPELVRATMAMRDGALEPVLLIKATSLNLKHLVLQGDVRLIVELDDVQHVAYGLAIHDASGPMSYLWSWVEEQSELEALVSLYREETLTAHLFNELAINVASTNGIAGSSSPDVDPAKLERASLREMGFSNQPSRKQPAFLTDSASSSPPQSPQTVTFNSPSWIENRAHRMSNGGSGHLISLFHPDEGNQQEELAFWLTDSLHSSTAIKSPRVQLESKLRELTDVLIASDKSTFLIESKTLSLLASDDLPSTSRLERNISKHIHKAVKQLTGAVRSLTSNLPVLDETGNELKVARTQPVHAIVLVPDLELLANNDAPEFGTLKAFAQGTGGYLHILDIAELLRVIQAAQTLVRYSESSRVIDVFDAYLKQRFILAQENNCAIFNMLLDSSALPNFGIRLRILNKRKQA